MARLRVITWNINGLRRVVAAFGGLQRLLEALGPVDVVCLQETKLTRGDLRRELALLDGWESFFAFTRGRVGYSGVVTFCRRDRTLPLAAEEGFTGVLQPPPPLPGNSSSSSSSSFAPSSSCSSPALHPRWLAAGFPLEELRALDGEGRAVVTDHGAFLLVNVYGPAITSEERAEERMSYKMRFYQALQVRLDGFLAKGRRVVLLGDFNIAPEPIDVCGATPRDFDARRADRAWLRGLMTRGRGGGQGRREEQAPAGSGGNGGAERCEGRRCEEVEEASGDGAEEGYGMDMQEAGTMSYGAGGGGGGGGGGEALPPFVDTFRAFHPRRQHAYTCWNTSSGARVNNYGSRIDHILVADGGSSRCGGTSNSSFCPVWVVAADIMPELEGSDHAPAWVELELPDDQFNRGSVSYTAGSSALPPLPLSSRSFFDGSRQATLHAVLARWPPAAPTAVKVTAVATDASAGVTGAATAPSPAGAAGCAALATLPHSQSSAPSRRGGGGRSASTAVVVTAASAAAASLHRSASCPGAAQGRKGAGGCGVSGGGGRGSSAAVSLAAATVAAARGGAAQKTLTAFMRPKAPPPHAPAPTTQPAECLSAHGHRQDGGTSRQCDPASATVAVDVGAGPENGPGPGSGLLQAGGFAGGGEAVGAGGSLPELPHGQYGLEVVPRGVAEVYGGGGLGWSPGGHVCASAGAVDPGGGGGCGGREGGPEASPLRLQQVQPPLYGVNGPMPYNADIRYGATAPCSFSRESLTYEERVVLTAAAAAVGDAGSDAGAGAGRSQAALAWRQIQDQMKPPRCSGHGEACAIRTVKKRGDNNGRQFWCCARPDGLPPHGRCDFFQWARGRNNNTSAAAAPTPTTTAAATGGGGGGGRSRAAMSNMPRKKPRRQ